MIVLLYEHTFEHLKLNSIHIKFGSKVESSLVFNVNRS